ncbi:MAG: sulfate transporter [Verrucomicrobia bacterium RIFCSPHIGHO2_12_FULL_41_10]|nr:MAG: sulfate transporter [Verrucomicrobia bacterium RIFCSPHIGHO2_12_FULL_41_10]
MESPKIIVNQIFAGIVVFLVALPLSLGIALASGAPLFSGILGGIVGGLVVGLLSGSSVSVSGPSAALAAVVAQSILHLGSFDAFLLAVVFAGFFQFILGLSRSGFIAKFFPSSVVKGLLAATGTLIILKQIPHLFGYDSIAFGDSTFFESDGKNTFSEIVDSYFHIQVGSLAIGIGSLLFLIAWERIKRLKNSSIPAPLLVVVFAVGLSYLLRKMGSPWAINATHLVQVPQITNVEMFMEALKFPDFKQLYKPAIYEVAIMIAASASLETLLNLEATDKIDPEQRLSSPNRELIAQGIGNIILGFIGGIPITSAIVRSSANITAGGRTRLSTIIHGLLLFGCVILLPAWLNEIPLSVLAAILIVVGARLATPQLFIQMWKSGYNQFLPFFITIAAIIFTNLLFGILIGLSIGLLCILHSNLSRPISQVLERHAAGDVLRIELANQVSFLNRPSLMKTLDEVPSNSHLLLDARFTDYIDPDILSLINDYIHSKATIRNVTVSLLGFKEKYAWLKDQIRFIDYSTRELQSKLMPSDVLEIMKEGNRRFYEGRPILRDQQRQVQKTSEGQYPMGVILSCIDSRAPVEMIFDAGLGDFFSVRIAGNVANDKELGSIEYACLVAGAKLILVLCHSSCGAVGAAVDFFQRGITAKEATGCEHLDPLLLEIQKFIDSSSALPKTFSSEAERKNYVDSLAKRNVQGTIRFIREQSPSLRRLENEGKIAIAGAFYDMMTGKVEFYLGNRPNNS